MSREIKKSLVVTVSLNDEEQAALYERMDYLSAKNRGRRISKAEAIRHAILATGYKRGNGAKKDDNTQD